MAQIYCIKMRTIIFFPMVLFLLVSCASSPEISEDALDEGVALLYQGKIDAAMIFFDKAILYNSENFEAYYYKGNCLANKKKYSKAILEYNKAIKYKPDYAEAFANRGEMEFYLGDRESACRDWRKAESLGMQDMSDKTRGCK